MLAGDDPTDLCRGGQRGDVAAPSPAALVICVSIVCTQQQQDEELPSGEAPNGARSAASAQYQTGCSKAS